MLKFSANLSMLFTEVPLINRFALAAQAGFKTVEIQFPYELDVEDIAQQLNHHQLTLNLINIPVGDLMQGGDGLAGVVGKEPDFERALQLALDYASTLKVPKVNILSGKHAQQDTPEQGWKTLVSNTTLACCQLQQAGILAVAEMVNPITMPRFWLSSLERFSQLQQAVQPTAPLQLQFDTFHIAMINQPVVRTFQTWLPHIGHIQFADSPQRHEPYTGDIDFDGFFNAVKVSGYQGCTAAEYKPKTNTTEGLGWLNHWQTT